MRVRIAMVLAVTLGFASAGCDDGDSGDVDSGTTPMVDAGGGGEDAGGGGEDAGGGGEDAGGGGEDAGGGGEDAGPTGEDGGPTEAAPIITRVAWTAVSGCTRNNRSDVTIDVTVTDADTEAAMLTFTGSATGCEGSIDSASATISCPHAASYNGTVTVTDPEGNSDSETFTFGPCDTGGVDF